jgi:hypothetical protein
MHTDHSTVHRPAGLVAGALGAASVEPVEPYRASLAAGLQRHWRAGCRACQGGHPCPDAQALLALLDFIT